MTITFDRRLPLGWYRLNRDEPCYAVPDGEMPGAMAGMRDRLNHHYFGVDCEIVRDVIHNRIPDVQLQVGSMLED